MSDRIIKVNELLRQKLGEAILEEVEMPQGVLASIVEIKTSSDLRYSQVRMNVFPEEAGDKIVHKFNLLAKRLQAAVASKVVLKNSPKLQFVLDKTEDQAEDIEKILDKIKEEIGE